MPPDQTQSPKTPMCELSERDAEEFVRENAGWMLVLAERMLADRALAEDVVQEALINALRSMNRFEERSSLRTWLHRITVNTTLSKKRKQEALAEEPINELLPEFDQYDCRVEQPWTHLASAEEILANAETRTRVTEGINALPDSYRLVLLLRDIEGYDTAETAKNLEISEANVKVRLHRARAALKKILEPVLCGEETQ